MPESVTRIEVIERGVARHYINYDIDGCWISMQDGGKTMKIFINETNPIKED